MTERWNVTFMQGDQAVFNDVVEADDEVTARAVAKEHHADIAHDGVLVMEYHTVTPEMAVAVLGNIWDEVLKLDVKPGRTPPWGDLHPGAKAAFTHYFREIIGDALDQIIPTVIRIDQQYRRAN